MFNEHAFVRRWRLIDVVVQVLEVDGRKGGGGEGSGGNDDDDETLLLTRSFPELLISEKVDEHGVAK